MSQRNVASTLCEPPWCPEADLYRYAYLHVMWCSRPTLSLKETLPKIYPAYQIKSQISSIKFWYWPGWAFLCGGFIFGLVANPASSKVNGQSISSLFGGRVYRKHSRWTKILERDKLSTGAPVFIRFLRKYFHKQFWYNLGCIRKCYTQ